MAADSDNCEKITDELDALPDDCNMAGEITSEVALFRFAALLRQNRINASVGESCHYSEGHYIRILENEEVDFTLERISADTYLARVFANHKETLSRKIRFK